MTSIRPRHVNHMNVVLPDMAAGIAHLEDVYGAEYFADLPQPAFGAALIQMAHAIFEYFVPNDYLLCARQGPHFLGLEYEADMDEVRAAVAERGIGIVRDIGAALHTDPAHCFGVAYEFYGSYFYDLEWPMIGGKIRPRDYWRDEHPLGLTGLLGYTHAVADIDAASAFLQSFLGAELVYEARRPAIAARAIGLRIAGSLVELVTPEGGGALLQHMLRHGEGIRSVIMGVRDTAQARVYLTGRGLPLAAGTADRSFASAPEANLGLIFEFAEDMA